MQSLKQFLQVCLFLLAILVVGAILFTFGGSCLESKNEVESDTGAIAMITGASLILGTVGLACFLIYRWGRDNGYW